MESALVFAVIAAIIGGLIMIAYVATVLEGNIGMTSEAAVVVTLLAGAMCYRGELALAAALDVAMAVLLELKLQTRTLVSNITRSNVYATLTFAVITLIILPVLPDRSQALLRILWIQLSAALVISMAYCIYLYRTQSTGKQEEQDKFKNPFELGPALTFGLIYAVILVVANAARLYFGNTGIYLSSIAPGLADVDAITLSLAELSSDAAGLDMNTAARGIVMTAVSNTLVKGGVVLGMGSAGLRNVIMPGMLATLVRRSASCFCCSPITSTEVVTAGVFGTGPLLGTFLQGVEKECPSLMLFAPNSSDIRSLSFW